jgi:hypothetical protein
MMAGSQPAIIQHGNADWAARDSPPVRRSTDRPPCALRRLAVRLFAAAMPSGVKDRGRLPDIFGRPCVPRWIPNQAIPCLGRSRNVLLGRCGHGKADGQRECKSELGQHGSSPGAEVGSDSCGPDRGAWRFISWRALEWSPPGARLRELAVITPSGGLV